MDDKKNDTPPAEINGVNAAPQLRKILMVFHREESQSGAVGQWLRRHGFELDIRRPRFGDSLPASLDEHAGAIVFGGPMSANDPDAYVRTEIDWLSVPLREEKPFLGICLGAQMLAKNLGSDVRAHPDDFVEVGYYPIEPSEAGASMMRWPGHVYQWHTEGFALPRARASWLVAMRSRIRRFNMARRHLGCSFTPK